MSLVFTKLRALALALACLSGCLISPERAQWRDKSDALLAAQEKNAERLETSSGTRKVIYAAFALNSDSAAFQGDVTLVRDVLRSINPQISALLLSNQLEYFDIAYPFATKENVKHALSGVARLADKDTLLVLLFSSHGSPNLLSIKIANGDYSDSLSAEELRSYLEDLTSIPTIIIISACYSGSFVPDLSGGNRILLTSASRDRSSFGCSVESKMTYFIEALFQSNFDSSMSLSELFSQASKKVAEREKQEQLQASRPQIFVGERMKKLAAVPLRELLTKIEERP